MTEPQGKQPAYAFDPEGRVKLLAPIETLLSREVRTFLRTILDDVDIQRRLIVRGEGYWPAGLVLKASYLARSNHRIGVTERDAIYAAATVHRLPDLLHESALKVTGGGMLDEDDIRWRIGSRVFKAMERLEREDSFNCRLIRQALGSAAVTDVDPAETEPGVESARMQKGRLQTIVEVAWFQAVATERSEPLLRRLVQAGSGKPNGQAQVNHQARKG